MKIEAGSTWRHAEGVSAIIRAVGANWVEPIDCGRWPLGDFMNQWEPVAVVAAPPMAPIDCPELDGRPNAHPAFHRGVAFGAERLAHQLLSAIRNGLRVQHQSPDVLCVLTEIDSLKAQLERSKLDLSIARGDT